MKDLFHAITTVIEREFYDETFLQSRWPEIRERHLERLDQATTAKEKEAVLKGLIESLGVSHSVLIDPVLAEYIAQQEEAPQSAITVAKHGEILLVQIRSFEVRSLRATDLHHLAQSISSASAVVLDLRLNTGGSCSAVTELASLFLPPETPIVQLRDRWWRQRADPYLVRTLPEDENLDHQLEVGLIREHHWVEYRTQSHDFSAAIDKPIIVVIDGQCYSSGEVFVQSLKEFSTAKIVGRPTAGYVVAAAEHNIGDGYMVLVPFSEMLSGKGNLLEGIGVKPDVEIDLSQVNEAALIEELYSAGLLSVR